MGAAQAVEIVHRREIAAGADAGRAGRRLRGRAPAGRGAAARAASSTRSSSPERDARAHRLRAGGRSVTPDGRRGAVRAVQSRNADRGGDPRRGARGAGREGLRRADDGRDRPRRSSRRTAVYFYFPNKRAVVDRLIQQRVQRHVRRGVAATSTATATRGDELRDGARARRRRRQPRRRPCSCSPRQLSGAAASTCPPSGRPTSCASSSGADARIARDQERGIAPADIPPRHLGPGAAGDGRAPRHARARARARRRDRVDPRARRAVVARGVLAAWRGAPA